MNSKIYEILQRSLKNISRNYIDEFVETNAEFRAKAGLREKIIRSTNGKCCKWCDKLAGIYDYPAPKDVYRRHDNCDCTVTYISEKGAQDVHTKDMLKAKELKERIEKLSNTTAPIPNKLEDVKKEYFRSARSVKEKVEIEEGVDLAEEKNAIANAKILNDFFGDSITVLKAANTDKQKTPDYLWRGKLWEQKTTSSAKAIDSALRKAMKQIQENPGGIILDITNNKDSLDEIYKAIESRIERRNFTGDIDVIVIKSKKIVSILRHKKRGDYRPPTKRAEVRQNHLSIK